MRVTQPIPVPAVGHAFLALRASCEGFHEHYEQEEDVFFNGQDIQRKFTGVYLPYLRKNGVVSTRFEFQGPDRSLDLKRAIAQCIFSKPKLIYGSVMNPGRFYFGDTFMEATADLIQIVPAHELQVAVEASKHFAESLIHDLTLEEAVNRLKSPTVHNKKRLAGVH